MRLENRHQLAVDAVGMGQGVIQSWSRAQAMSAELACAWLRIASGAWVTSFTVATLQPVSRVHGIVSRPPLAYVIGPGGASGRPQ